VTSKRSAPDHNQWITRQLRNTAPRDLTAWQSQRGTGVGVCMPTIRVPASAGLTQWTFAKPEVYCADASTDKTKSL
jgi:hypothetical protein